MSSMGFTVIVKGGSRPNNIDVDVYGEVTLPATDADLLAFGLTMPIVKKAFSKLDHNSTHDYIYFREPCCGSQADIYRRNGCKPITKTMRPVKWTWKSSVKQDSGNAEKFSNNYHRIGTYTADVQYSVTNTLGTTWSQCNTTSKGFKLDYKLLFPGSAELNFSSTTGRDDVMSKGVTMTSRREVRVDLEPGEKAVASITVSHRIIEINVKYEVTLSGDVIGHILHGFWSTTDVERDVDDVLEAAGLKDTINCEENIKIDYFTCGDVTLKEYN